MRAPGSWLRSVTPTFSVTTSLRGETLSFAMRCPDAMGNPFLHLRLGQCQFELAALDRAADELARAYMGGGPELFSQEDPKYLAFLKTRITV